MPNYLDIESWSRKRHFQFFKEYEQPFFNICTHLEVTDLVRFCKESDTSFFLASLYLSLKSANEVEPFRYRIRGDTVVIHELVHAGSTILMEEETFGFCYFDYVARYEDFVKNAAAAMVCTQENPFDPQDHRDDLIHYSPIPWISFTSFSHARKPVTHDSIPKIVFGKYFSEGETTKMPISVEVHHALMDGIHVARFLNVFQEHLSQVEDRLVMGGRP